MFLVAPVFKIQTAIYRVQATNHGSCSVPTGFLVEPRGALVADRTSEPCSLHTALGQPRLDIRDQGSGNACSASLSRHVELVKLLTPQHAEPERRAEWPDDTRIAERRRETFREPF